MDLRGHSIDTHNRLVAVEQGDATAVGFGDLARHASPRPVPWRLG